MRDYHRWCTLGTPCPHLGGELPEGVLNPALTPSRSNTDTVHPNEAPEVHPSVVPDVRWWPLKYTQVKLLMYMMAYSVHLLAYTVYHVRPLIYMIRYTDHLMANAVHPSEAPEVHPSVVPNVRWWPLQYTWWQMQYIREAPEVHPSVVPDVRRWPLHYTCWQMQYTQVKLLKCTPVLFLMLDDGPCSTLDGKCSTTKWSFWCAWWHIQYTCWHIQYTMWCSWFTW